MPRQAKGPRLVLLQGRVDTRSGKPLPAIWFIRDGQVKRSTGSADDGSGRPTRAAEDELRKYLAEKHTEAVKTLPAESRSDPAQVNVADVLSLYLDEKVPTLADSVSAEGRIAALNEWWGAKTVSDVKRSNCIAYVRYRMTQPIKSFKEGAENGKPVRNVSEQGARRELEDLSAAIGWWDKEYHLSRRPAVVKPSKPETPRDALTRSEAAALLWAAMGWRKDEDGRWKRPEARRHGGWRSIRSNRLHLRRFILISLYSGSRSGVTKSLLWSEAPKQAWVDLEKGWIYRRGKQEREIKTKRRPLVKMPRRLQAHMARWARLDAELNATRQAEELPPIASVLHHGGEPIGSVRTGFAGIVADAGLAGRDPEITPHWLRHTAATWLMEADTPIWDAAAYMGMSPKTLEDHYGHHRPNHQADTAAKAGRGGR
jgi:integrase